MTIARAVPACIFRRKARPFHLPLPGSHWRLCDECHISMPFRGLRNQRAGSKLASVRSNVVSSWSRLVNCFELGCALKAGSSNFHYYFCQT